MQSKRQTLIQKPLHFFSMLHCSTAIICKNYEVVAVSQIFFHAQRILNVPVEFVEVNVRKNLARHITYRDAAWTFNSSLSLSLSLLQTFKFVV